MVKVGDSYGQRFGSHPIFPVRTIGRGYLEAYPNRISPLAFCTLYESGPDIKMSYPQRMRESSSFARKTGEVLDRFWMTLNWGKPTGREKRSYFNITLSCLLKWKRFLANFNIFISNIQRFYSNPDNFNNFFNSVCMI